MLKYIIRRLLQAIPLLFIITVISFSIITLAPGDPVYMFVNPEQLSPQDLDLIRHQLGLDRPIHIRYVIWLGNALKLNFGNSFLTGRPVMDMLFEAIPNTLILALASTIFALLVAIPAGIISAVKRNTWWDYVFSTVSFIGMSLPSFWFGLMLILFFSLKLGILPTAGMRANFDEFVLLDRLSHMIMPMLVLGMGAMAGQMRQLRGAMLEVIRQDYIRTARSKGLKERVVILKHGLRNALLPTITLLGFIIPSLFGGAVVTESIFSWPGVGRIAINAAFTRDYPIIMGNLMITSTMVILGSLIADLLYAVADPRIKYD
jgi:peptide/nickel transport system permease protein